MAFKKRVGIVTIHDIYNYGSILQAYATQKVIESLGYDVQIIDYKYPNNYHLVKGNTLSRLKGKLLFVVNSFLKDLLPGRKYHRYLRNYSLFKKNYYKLSSYKYESIEEIKTNPPVYDIYLSGSDQIWRADFVKFDECFLLNFVQNVKKVSYASSFGSIGVPDEYKDRYANALKQYNHIGVRESKGLEIVKELTGKNAVLVLDPTLLLSKDEWSEVLVDYKSDKPYILCYGQNMGDSYMENFAIYLRKTRFNDHKIVRLNGKFYDYFNKEMEFVLDAGPGEFLGLFKNASLVLAQSFHATVFSIIFEKPFFSILRGSINHDIRQINLLNMFNLSDRKVIIGDDFDNTKGIQEQIDYKVISSILHEEKLKSLNYLKVALGEKK